MSILIAVLLFAILIVLIKILYLYMYVVDTLKKMHSDKDEK